MGQLKKPDVEVGPLMDLIEAMHRLHLDAGEPSLPRMAKAWEAGHQAGMYKISRSRSGVAALFSSGELPNGEALNDLVAMLMNEFMDTQRGEVRASQAEFRRLRTSAARHQRAPSASDLVNELRRMGNGYLRLAEGVQQAENMDARSISARNRSNAYMHAATVATEVLGPDHPYTAQLNQRWQELEPELWADQGR
ncbi:hypothetical protein [Streptomyces sp. NBC_01568]|uniref:hypothetical protein n=1 Tax=Streptomyces sp. NBC_01568 TaxID=2975882 RepID=UPI002F914FD6